MKLSRKCVSIRHLNVILTTSTPFGHELPHITKIFMIYFLIYYQHLGKDYVVFVSILYSIYFHKCFSTSILTQHQRKLTSTKKIKCAHVYLGSVLINNKTSVVVVVLFWMEACNFRTLLFWTYVLLYLSNIFLITLKM